MIRALLAATALTTSMTMAALAQDTDTSTELDTNAGTEVEAPMESDAGVDTELDAGTDTEMSTEADDMVADDMTGDTGMDAGSAVSLSAGYMQSDDDFLGSRIMGATVYNSAAEDAETIGDINDIIFNADGRMIAAIIGIGGFLGIGEKAVAVGFEELDWTTHANGDPRLVLTGATFESLEAAPEFVWETPELAADPLMTEMDTEGALDGGMVDPAGQDSVDVEGDADVTVEGDVTLETDDDLETDTTMDAEGDTAMDVEADATTNG